MSDVHWVDPGSIRFKISPFLDLASVPGGMIGGDWDIERRHEFTGTAKYRAMAARLIDGRRWEESELFTDAYARRIARDGHVGGKRTLEALAAYYEARFVPMAESMRRHGFQLADPSGRQHALPALLIGRDGEAFIGNQGNHRLAIAKLLGLDRIAGRIACRHSST